MEVKSANTWMSKHDIAIWVSSNDQDVILNGRKLGFWIWVLVDYEDVLED